MDEQEIIIISVGGSLIVPDQIDTIFLTDFKKLVIKYVNKGKKFVIISGGGRTARNYQAAANNVTKLDDEDLDWLGIHATRLNAQLLRTIFKKYAHPRIVKDPTQKILFIEPVLVAAGWRPGCSTDYDAVLLANNLGVKKIINLSNIDYVYTKDPKKYKDAKKIEQTSWREFRKIVGNKWSPGLNAPFDPIAAKECDESGITVYIMNGKNLKNLEDCIKGKEFKGTLIT